MRILIMGLPGSGKTYLAKYLTINLANSEWFNADIVRDHYNDWDFSNEGRIRQSQRMKTLSLESTKKFIFCDFVAPTEEIRNIFSPDFTIWVNTICESRYEDTNKIFVNPSNFDLEVTTKDVNYWGPLIIKKLEEIKC